MAEKHDSNDTIKYATSTHTVVVSEVVGASLSELQTCGENGKLPIYMYMYDTWEFRIYV